MKVSDMTVGDFIALCRARGLHFTATWIARAVRMIETPQRTDDRIGGSRKVTA